MIGSRSAPTVAFQHYRSSIASVKEVVDDISDNEVDSTLDELKIRSLILLGHSTIEEYLEELSGEIARASVSKFEQNGIVNIPLFSLLTHHKYNIAESTIEFSGFDDRILAAAKECLLNHENVIDQNNGIKQTHHNKLLFPIGLRLADVDQSIAPALDAFASKRGGVAHSMRIQIVHTKSSIFTDLLNIEKMLEQIDSAACHLSEDVIHQFKR